MRTFKSTSDVEQLRNDPIHYTIYDTVKELVVPVIAEYTDSVHPYRPENDGFLVLVEPDDVDRVLDDLDMPYKLSETPATCNHYLKLMKRVLNLAIQWEIIDGPNPAVGIQQYRELNLVENYMDEEKLQRLLAVLTTDKNRTVCHIILYLLSIGARLNEALQAK